MGYQVQHRIDGVVKVLQRPVTPDEATALAYWTMKRMSLMSYGAPIGIAFGAWRYVNLYFYFAYYHSADGAKDDVEIGSFTKYDSHLLFMILVGRTKQPTHFDSHSISRIPDRSLVVHGRRPDLPCYPAKAPSRPGTLQGLSRMHLWEVS